MLCATWDTSSADLLRKTGLLFEFKIVDTRDQVGAQAKTSAPIAVALHQYEEDLQFADHVLAHNATTSEKSGLNLDILIWETNHYL
jgi:hypothetical protein